MNKLKTFIQERIKMAERSPQYAEEFRHQAYGAVMYHLAIHPEDTDELLIYWDDFIREDFSKIIFNYHC